MDQHHEGLEPDENQPDDGADETLQLDSAVVITGFSAVAGTMTGLNEDGEESDMTAVVLEFRGAVDGEEVDALRFVLPAVAWDDLHTCGEQAILSFAWKGRLDVETDHLVEGEGNDVEDARWEDFIGRLTEVIDVLEPDEFLILRGPTERFVQVVIQHGEIRVETVSNQYLTDSNAVPYDSLELLADLGWERPTHFADEDEHKADGSPNHYLDLAPDSAANDIARLFADTLRRVHDVDEPEDLTYRCSDENGTRILLPGLALSRSPS